MPALPRPTPGVLGAFGSGTYAVTRPQRVPVVVLDPDAGTRTAVASTLGDFHVHQSDSLSTASALVSEVRPLAIVCSMAFDALQLVCFSRWLRATFSRSIALVMLTPRGDTMKAIQALQLGARACLDIPIDPVRLRTVVAKHTAPAASETQRSGAA